MKNKLLFTFIAICLTIFAIGTFSVSAETTAINVSSVEELQSAHPYSYYMDTTWVYTHPTEAQGLFITFSTDTATELGCDYIHILDGNNNLVGSYDGDSLSGKTISVTGNVIKIRLTSDSGVNDYGFSVTQITAQSSSLSTNPDDYEFSNGTIIKYNGTSENILIPSEIDNCPVTRIGERAFAECNYIASVIIPEGITTIDDYAFYNCNNLKSVTVPESFTTPGNRIFSGCKNITEIYWNAIMIDETIMADFNFFEYAGQEGDGISVVFGDRVKKIPDYMFHENVFAGAMPKITSVHIGSSVEEVGEFAFYYCRDLKSVTMDDNVTVFGRLAFCYCSNLESVYITNLEAYLNCRYTLFGEDSLEGRRSSSPMYYANNLYINNILVTEITIPSTVTAIPDLAFSGCSSLTSITIPDSVTTIGECAFSSCYGLTEITIPNSVTSIGNWAFRYCTDLTKITIPNNVTSIGTEAFYNSGYYNNSSNWENNVLYINNHLIKANNSISGAYTIKSGTKTIADYAFYGCTGLTSVTIPDGVIGIGGYAFYGCKDLTEITIPDGVIGIGGYAFYGCKDLTEITIPDSVTSVGRLAFCNCTGLTEITIPDDVTSIGIMAFYGCEGLKSVTIENGVTSIGGSAFDHCSKLESVYITDLEAYLNCEYGNRASNPMCYARKLYLNGNLLEGKITIPNTVTKIPSYAFRDRTGLTSITIPDSVTSIDWGAFSGCTGLTKITIPDGVTSIGGSAFYGCTSLTEIIIPDGVTSIGGSAFNGCKGLTEITIPDGVTGIGDFAFDGCRGLTEITIPDSIKSIGDYAFRDCNLSAVYYNGTEEEWSKVNIGEYNTPLKNARLVYMPSVRATISDDKKTFTIKPVNLPNGCKIILVLYGENDMLAESMVYDNAGADIVYTTTNDYVSAKVMAWDSFSSLKPLCEAEKVTFE